MQDQCQLSKGQRLRFQFQLRPSNVLGAAVLKTTIGLPKLFGSPICVSAQPKLTAYRGRLLSADPLERGTPVHAASFLRKREIVLESQLLARKSDLRLILVHEIFHFVWRRLGNAKRRQFRALLERELEKGARGELGESAEVHKLALAKIQSSSNQPSPSGTLRARGRYTTGVRSAGVSPTERPWRDYVCESFCDSGAWLYAGIKSNANWTLAVRWQRKRKQWFEDLFAEPRRC